MGYSVTIEGAATTPTAAEERDLEEHVAARVRELVDELPGVTSARGTFQNLGEQDLLAPPGDDQQAGAAQ